MELRPRHPPATLDRSIYYPVNRATGGMAATDIDALRASATISALRVVVSALLSALPRWLPCIGRIAQLTLAEVVQAVLFIARQLKFICTLGRVDVDGILWIRSRRIVRSRAAAPEDPLQEAHRRRLCHARDGRPSEVVGRRTATSGSRRMSAPAGTNRSDRSAATHVIVGARWPRC